MFDIDGIYNSQNDRIWAVNRLAADISGGIRQKRKFPQKFGNDTFGAAWTFQQDGARPHIHAKSQEWCDNDKHFPCFIDKDHWPPNSPDLNPLDYCIWDELAHQVNWEAVKSKKTLINEVKRAVRKVSVDVVFESCSS
ncbi:unnamed protein product [Rotaria magnacalcarata]|uniref:Uncharacterized protein n=1 Tax=Rotaria magnacalcarata TaxID=392030 RepID=A0A815GX77_9BILA|nr:unnamed protein product [Rotaria magnacalcarata]